MRTLVLTCSFAAIVLAQQQPQPVWYEHPPVVFGAQADAWQLALFSSKQGYSKGDPVLVKLVARNNSRTLLKVSVEKSMWRVAQFKVERIPGNEVLKLRPYKDAIDRIEKNGGGIMRLNGRPGGLVSFRVVDLQKLYDMTPGSYTVVATVRLPSIDGKAYIPVASNPITISVLPQ